MFIPLFYFNLPANKQKKLYEVSKLNKFSKSSSRPPYYSTIVKISLA